MNQETVQKIVFKAIAETNLELPAEKQLEISLETGLFGSQGKLDSLDLVNLVVTTEQIIEEELGVSLTLANEKVLVLEESPFQTVGSLVSFITDQVSS
jgi:acyl carrier protein